MKDNNTIIEIAIISLVLVITFLILASFYQRIILGV